MFGSSVCLCLGVCLVIFGIFGYLISVKLNEQNDKIKNMVELICTITKDLQLLKLQQPTTVTSSTSNVSTQLDYTPTSYNSINTQFIERLHADISDQINPGSRLIQPKKIVVSDCEISSNDSDEDDDTDDEVTEYDEGDEYPADTEDDPDDDFSPIEIIITSEKKEQHLPNSTTNDTVDTGLNTVISEEVTDENIVQCVLKEDTTSDTSTSVTKTIILDLTNDTPDYHKLSIRELRKIAIERNLIDVSSKAKKSDILKLL